MPRRQYENRPTDLRCIDNGHLVTMQVRNKLHYVDGYGPPVRFSIPHGALDHLRCPVPGCGSLLEEANA